MSDVGDQLEREDAYYALTPMQQLVLETLASRYRLGHNIWTFSMNQALPKALKGLEKKGYVAVLSPVIERTTRAMLTEKGRWLIFDPLYVPPVIVCGIPCDDDCEADCHGDHDINSKKQHFHEDCPVVRYKARMAE